MSEPTAIYVHRQNVRNFTRQLAATQDEAQRKQLLILLAEAQMKAIAAGWTPILD